MNSIYRLTLCGLALVCWCTARADLVSVSSDTFIESYSGATDVIVELETNPVTGEYAVCFAENPSAIKCEHRDSDDNGVAPELFLSTGTSGVNIDFNNLDVALNDDGDMYVMWTGEGNFTSGIVAFLYATDSSGQPLSGLEYLESTTTDWIHVRMALTPSAVWLVGVRKVDDGTLGVSDLEVVAEYYNLSGDLQGTISLYSETLLDLFPDSCDSADVSASRTGDLILTWMEPTSVLCEGTIYAQTYRESGSSISDVTQISDTEQDDSGDDVSAYYGPVATAYENGEYVIAWTDAVSVYSANLSLDGDIATSQEEILGGLAPKIGGNSANQDYVVISESSAGGSCVIEGRLAFDADTTPDVTFSPADCGFDSDIAFLADGQMLLARTTTDTGSGNVVVNRIGLPAEVEVSNVSVLEGDIGRGQGGVAAINISLTRAHPAGEDIEVSYFTRDSTALVGIDYQLTLGSVTFTGGSGVLSQTVLVPIIPDDDYEDDEIFDFILENPINAVLKNDGETADVTIIDDDNTPDITADCTDGNANNCRSIDEPAVDSSTEVTITLTMAASIDSDITVSYATSDVTATAGEDYVATSGTLQFLAGSTEAAFVLTVLGDEVNENTETFTVTLSAGSSVSLPDTVLTFSIINEEICFVDIDPNAVVVLSTGGDESFDVTSFETCDWDVSTDADWITITSATSNTGSGTVNFTVDPFDSTGGAVTRSGEITVTLNDPTVTDSETFIVDQDGDCTFTIDSSSANIDVAGGTGTFNVTVSDESCDWDATSAVDWVTITSPTEPVTGDGTVVYTVDSNADTANVENGSRSTVLTSEEFTYTISQDGCTFDLDQSSVDVDADGSDTVSVGVLAPTAASGPCPWTAVSNSSWILIGSGSSGTGGGTVTLDVLDNASVDARVGSVSIGDEVLTVNQSGQACDYSLDSDSISVCPDGNTFDLSVTATDGCSWTLDPQESWLSVLTNSTGTGSETASGLVSANLSETSRSGTIQLLASMDSTVEATVSFTQDGYLVYEPFESGLPPAWLFTPNGAWTVANNQLRGALLGLDPGLALDQTISCRNCKVETSLRVLTASSNSVNAATLVGWYEDENNYVGLAMDEFSNRWRLFQVASGVMTSAQSASLSIVPNISYALTLRYDGTTFYGEVGGQTVVQLDRQAGTDPIGYAGFQVDSNDAVFDELRVTGMGSTLQVLLQDSFELPDTVSFTGCAQQ